MGSDAPEVELQSLNHQPLTKAAHRALLSNCPGCNKRARQAVVARRSRHAQLVDDSGSYEAPPGGSLGALHRQHQWHKAFIEVTEEGSVAAAATALLGFRSARPLIHTKFVANHPFLFLIYDKQVDTILFFGVYQHPPTP